MRASLEKESLAERRRALDAPDPSVSSDPGFPSIDDVSGPRRIGAKPVAHLTEIDRLKGVAILFVICIHAKLANESFIFQQLIDRGVSIFLVLFGITAELWWERAPHGAAVLRRWYEDRFARLLPGYWAVLAIYWTAILSRQWPEEHYSATAPEVLLSVFGVTPEARTTWFVTVVLFYILIFPALRGAIRRIGPWLSLPLAAGATWLSCWYVLDVIALGQRVFPSWNSDPNWYCHWIFAPRVAFHVVSGICIARYWQGRVSVRAMSCALALVVAGIMLSIWIRLPSQDVFGPIRRLSVAQLVDVPVAIALLGACRWLPLPKPIAAALVFCGRRSWGIYLGHMPVHEVLFVAGFDPERFSHAWRFGYACAMLVSGFLVAALGRAAWSAARRSLPRAGRYLAILTV